MKIIVPFYLATGLPLLLVVSGSRYLHTCKGRYFVSAALAGISKGQLDEPIADEYEE